MARLTHRTGPGWTYFVTTKAWQSTAVFQVTEVAQIFLTRLLRYRQKGNFLLHEFVLMPNHLHLLLTPAPSITLEKVMNLIKGGTSHEIHRTLQVKRQIWQSGFHESRVSSASDYKTKAESASREFELDPIPQGLKPFPNVPKVVGPKGPTPVTDIRRVSA